MIQQVPTYYSSTSAIWYSPFDMALFYIHSTLWGGNALISHYRVLPSFYIHGPSFHLAFLRSTNVPLSLSPLGPYLSLCIGPICTILPQSPFHRLYLSCSHSIPFSSAIWCTWVLRATLSSMFQLWQTQCDHQHINSNGIFFSTSTYCFCVHLL